MKKIVGIQSVDYISRKTNKQVTGLTLHLSFEDARVRGMATETVFVSSQSICYEDVAALPVGSEVNVYYNRYGSVEDIRPVKK